MNGAQEPKHAINSIQFLFLAHTVPIGVGILGISRFVADKSGHDAWLSILISGLYPQAGILFSWLLLRRFRSLGLYEIHRVLFKKWIGGLLNVLFAAYCVFAFFMILRTFVEVVQTWMFPMTPVWILTLLFLIPAVYASVGGLQLQGRYAIAVFFLTAWIVLLTYFPFREGTMSHLLPIGSNGLKGILSGSLLSSLSLLGSELLVVFYPHLTYKKDFLPAATIANWLMILVYVLNSVASAMFFASEQLKKTIWPMLTMFKHVQLPFIERFETIVIAIWILQVVNSSSAYLWAGMRGVELTLPLNKTLTYACVSAATIIGSMMVKGRIEINVILNILSKTGFALLIGYPLLLWLVALVMRKKGGKA